MCLVFPLGLCALNVEIKGGLKYYKNYLLMIMPKQEDNSEKRIFFIKTKSVPLKRLFENIKIEMIWLRFTND